MAIKLEARLLEPALCHSFPGKPTCLAYDSESERIAVGCDNGKVAVLYKNKGQTVEVLSQDLYPELHIPVKLMCFCKNFLVVAPNTPQILIWSFTCSQPAVLNIKSIVTAINWSQTSSILYLGTATGKIYILEFKELNREGSVPAFNINELESKQKGEVISIQCQERNPDSLSSVVLITFSTGSIRLLMKSTDWLITNAPFTTEPDKIDAKAVTSWWHTSKEGVLVAYDNGCIKPWFSSEIDKTKTQRDLFSCNGTSFTKKSSNPIMKLQHIYFTSIKDRWLIYSGGCSSLPEGANCHSHILSIYSAKMKRSKPLISFNSRVVDFLCLPHSTDPSILLVLTESELVPLDVKGAPWIDKEKMMRLSSAKTKHQYADITSPVTSLQHCGMLSSGNGLHEGEQLIVTGHGDGSVRLWTCFTDEAHPPVTRLHQVVYTANYFNFPCDQIQQYETDVLGDKGEDPMLVIEALEQTGKKEPQPTEDDKNVIQKIPELQEITIVKVVGNQQFLLVVNKLGHCLLFKLQQTQSNQQEAHPTKPQSQEVILKEDQSVLTSAIQTPDRFHSPQSEGKQDVQLLQHFCCYSLQGQATAKLEPVVVKCVDYNDEMKVLAVGTKKGLIVLDTTTNLLVEVIGSEKKLQELCGCAKKEKPPSDVGRVVTCVETAENLLDKDCVTLTSIPQLTLWVGTAGGSLGVFTVTRNKDGEPLQLVKTGEGRQIKASNIVEIYTQPNDEPVTPSLPESSVNKENVIAENQQVKREKKQLITENQRVMRENKQLKTENQRVTRENEQLITENQRVTREKGQLMTEKNQLQQELQTANTRADEQLWQLRQQLMAEQQQATREKEQLQQELQAANARRDESQEQVQQLQRRLSFMKISEGREEQPHWVVRREEVEMTSEVVGEGGWGEVRVAKFRGIRVAAKYLYKIILSEYNLERFTREMTIAAMVRHPNLLLFIGATREGEPVILTELMPTSLRRELEKRELPRIQITSICQDVSRALCYLHQWKPYPIIHRDISSGNVLLEPLLNGWRAKVSDYGSANFMNDVATAGPGSPTYAAPEARYPDEHSPKMDVFSFGVLLVEMCLRKLPESQTERRKEQMQRIQWPAMVSLIRSCTSERSADRPSMSDIMELLDRIQV